MKFFTSKTKKLPREAKKILLPREEFIAQGKERFLAAFDASAFAANTRVRHSPRVEMFFKIGIGAMAALCIAVGLSAYADTANVPVTSPLYPLKRISENVQLTLTPMSRRPQLQATFAVRRANEIAALQTSQPSSTLIPELTSNLDQDIQSSLGVSVSAAVEATSTTTSTSSPSSLPSSSVDKSISVYCKAFDVSTSGVLIGQLENSLSLRSSAFAQFNEQCGPGDYHNNADNRGVGGQRPSHQPRMSASSTTMNGATTTPDFFGGRGDHHDDGESTTTPVTSIVTSTITSTANLHVSVGL